ncbi:MAG: NADH-quinone oxidoreductase subunit N [Candidatus Omnitrophica bacterium]|nr:NADH-quinone oxidoreductase subunit N [Candidatus Omnitrophota bacterium]
MIWQPIAVELGLCGWIALLLIADLLFPASRYRLWQLALGGIVAFAAGLWWQRAWLGHTVGPMFIFDRLAWYFKWLFLLTMAVVILMTRIFTHPLAGPRDLRLTTHVGEFYVLLFSALLGMLVLASVHDLLLLFISLELLTFSLYVMAAYVKTDARSVEAGMKYLILGSVSSGFLVYGISLLYGVAGTTDMTILRHALASMAQTGQLSPLAKAGMLLVLAGLGFKIAAVPFHFWVPDVYEGAPIPVVALLSVGSKMAGIVALLRVLYDVFWPAHVLWGAVLAVLSAATMLYGNLAAIPQTNIKRLLGYSSIGHAGYLLMGLSTALQPGAEAVGYYALAYVFSNLAVFLVVVIVSRVAGSDRLEEYDGLSRRSPLLAATMFTGLLSLAGVPPLAGFIGKLLVLLSTVESQRLWLVAIGAVNVAISLYYYLMVVRRMYVLQPATTQPVEVDRVTRWCLLGLIVGIVLIGVVQAPFVSCVSSALGALPPRLP